MPENINLKESDSLFNYIDENGELQEIILDASKIIALDLKDNFKSNNLEDILDVLGSETPTYFAKSQEEIENGGHGLYFNLNDNLNNNENNDVVKRLKDYFNATIGDVNTLSTNAKNNLVSSINEVLGVTNQISNPNLLINGDFQVWQRGTSFDIEKQRVYTVDRWLTGNDYGKCKISKNEGLRFDILSDGNFVANQQTNINELDLRNKTVTMSAFVKSSKPGRLVIFLKRKNEDWISLGSVEINKNGITQLTVTVPSDYDIFNTEFQGNGVVSGDYINIQWAKLELGSVATPFVPRLYAEELALCQRYYVSFNWGSETWNLGYGRLHSSGTVWINIPCPNEMRIKPSLYGGALDLSKWTFICDKTINNPTSISVRAKGISGVMVEFSTSTTNTNNIPINGHYNDGVIGGFDAEIY